MTTLYGTELTCPLCGRAFEATRIGSTNTFGPRTTELRQFPAGIDPLPLLVSTCPDCGFSGFGDKFGSDGRPAYNGPVAPEVAAQVQEQITPLVIREYPDAARRYELAAWIAGWRGDAAQEIGWLYLQAAWCADDEGLAERAQDYRLLAIRHFEEALASSEAPDDQRAPLTYLVGELHRRTGNEAAAAEWLDRAIALDDGQWAVLARQQRTAPRDVV